MNHLEGKVFSVDDNFGAAVASAATRFFEVYAKLPTHFDTDAKTYNKRSIKTTVTTEQGKKRITLRAGGSGMSPGLVLVGVPL